MRKPSKRRSLKTGLPPGTMVHVGERKVDRVVIDVIEYNEHEIKERRIDDPDTCRAYMDNRDSVAWINVVGLHDIPTLEKIGQTFNIHPLTLEDIVNTSQRPKLEDYGHYLYLVLRMIYRDKTDQSVVVEQVSFVLGRHFVVSFQEMPDDVFDTIRKRLRTNKGQVRKKGGDYLVYTLVDAIADHYFSVLEDIGDRIEDLQETVLTAAGPDSLRTIHAMKRECLFLRKSVWPLREALGALQKSDSPLMDTGVAPYWRDVYEHTLHVMDTLESLRDSLSGALEIYLSNIGNRMNEVMKMLTLIATIFIPLTFVAGVYGMNFEFMPELKWRYGYAFIMGLMIATAVGMTLFFRKKKWL